MDFILTTPNDKHRDLYDTVTEKMVMPVNHKALELWQEIRADYVRNQHRERRGLDPIVARWDRRAPARPVCVCGLMAGDWEVAPGQVIDVPAECPVHTPTDDDYAAAFDAA